MDSYFRWRVKQVDRFSSRSGCTEDQPCALRLGWNFVISSNSMTVSTLLPAVLNFFKCSDRTFEPLGITSRVLMFDFLSCQHLVSSRTFLILKEKKNPEIHTKAFSPLLCSFLLPFLMSFPLYLNAKHWTASLLSHLSVRDQRRYSQTDSGEPKHLGSKTGPPLLTLCAGHVRERRWVRERFAAPLLFNFALPFFVVKCCGKLDSLAKQRWMFSPKQSADGTHSRAKLCKSLHWFGAKPSWPLEYISRLGMEALCTHIS